MQAVTCTLQCTESFSLSHFFLMGWSVQVAELEEQLEVL